MRVCGREVLTDKQNDTRDWLDIKLLISYTASWVGRI